MIFLDYVRINCYDIWLAQWADKAIWGNPYGIWQHSNSGSVDWINGWVDLDIAYKDYPKIIKEAGINGLGSEAKPEPPKPFEPVKPSGGYKVGDKVILNGPVYGDSYGGGKGKTVAGTYTVSRIIKDRKCGVLLNDGLGWVPAGGCKVVG